MTNEHRDPAAVVYHIQCDRGDSYVGETSRPLPIRIKEHKTSVPENDSKSAIFDHIKTHPDHNIQWNNIKILANNQSDYKIRKLLEAIYIKRIQTAMNRDQGYYTPPAYHHLIAKSLCPSN